LEGDRRLIEVDVVVAARRERPVVAVDSVTVRGRRRIAREIRAACDLRAGIGNRKDLDRARLRERAAVIAAGVVVLADAGRIDGRQSRRNG